MDTLRRARKMLDLGGLRAHQRSKIQNPRSKIGMPAALEQLRSGVPLNWTQIEDDPELAVLDSLQDVAGECIDRSYDGLPGDLRTSIVQRLALRLPAPKPVQPAKPRPEPLAGFSEAVPVLTQAEEDVPPLVTNMPQWIGATLVATIIIIAVTGAIYGLTYKAPPVPTFAWIQVRDGTRNLTRIAGRPTGWTPPECRDFSFTNLLSKRDFTTMADPQQMQLSTGFPIKFAPQQFVVQDSSGAATYMLRTLSMGITPCESYTPSTGDRGTTVKLAYTARRVAGGQVATASELAMFEARQQPVIMELAGGSWKEIRAGNAHGIYWHGAPYIDMSGESWLGDVSVLAFEDNDVVTVMVGDPRGGVTEAMMTELMRQIEQPSPAATQQGQELAHFTWIELRNGDQVIAAAHPPQGWTSPNCVAPSPSEPSTRFIPVDSEPEAQADTGFAILQLPATVQGETVQVPQWTVVQEPTPHATYTTTVTYPTTYTLTLADMSVRPCTGDQLKPGDPNVRVKARYVVKHTSLPGVQPGMVSDITVFQWEKQTTGLDISDGMWKTVTVGDMKGVYSYGSRYRDPEGVETTGTTNVLTLEKGDRVFVLESRDAPERLLEQAAAAMR